MTIRQKNLPSLKALRCFEAAAKYGSFALAAEYLCLTPSAISHQIKTLEKIVGKSLFIREGNSVILTAPGKLLAIECSRALEYFSHSFSVLGNETSSPTTLTLASQYAIIQHWFMPRISQINACLDNKRLYVVSSADLQEHVPEDADIAILYGTGNVPGMIMEKLSTEKVFPVCSPCFLGSGPINLATRRLWLRR